MTETRAPYNVGPPGRVGICGGCQVPSFTEMMVLDKEGIAPGEPGHGVSFYEWALEACDGCGAGLLHRRVHDCFGVPEDRIDYWRLGGEETARLRGLIATDCPAPLEPTCACALHASLLASCRELPRPRWRPGPVALSPTAPWKVVSPSTPTLSQEGPKTGQ